MKRSKLLRSIVLLALIIQTIAPVITGFAAPKAQTAAEKAQVLLDALQPEERVGQLFLVQFEGDDTGPDSEIYNLITDYHIGGIMLRADQDNFVGPENTILQTHDLIQNLQQTRWLSTQNPITDTVTQQLYVPTYVPMFIGISQPGDGAPHDQILNGLTMLPSQAAIGATWDVSLAEQIGQIAGKELAAIGFNLFLGPSLDVLENPNPESEGDLGTRSFGGDPFWVGKMGTAFIQGLHTGSENRMAVIGKHFPGVGGSDRPIEEEIPTVRKSLEQLKQIELAPFFAVTGDAPSPEATLDGLLISHIRYQGFFGNIRATTRPISFDEASFSEILNLEPFSTWRDAGGVTISDDLGSRAVRRFYDPASLSFNARLVVRDAFLAGNDMLYLGDIIDTGDSTNAETVRRILEFFTDKYMEDSTFAQRVDEAALRVLTLKYNLYNDFALGDVLAEESQLALIGDDQQSVLNIARQGATLISPGLQDIDNILPNAPGLNDRMVFITDTRPFTQCSECPEQESPEIDALQQTIARLYGPESGNQIQRRNLSGFDFMELEGLLSGEPDTRLENELRNSDWIVISMQEIDASRPASLAIRRLLSERDDLLRQKNVIVFAFNAPYFLDATNISKLTAYFALYSKTPEAIEIAARILFKEFIPALGASPISVAGTGYDLISATSPNPEQIIPLRLTSPFIELSENDLEQDPLPPFEVELGTQLNFETEFIYDHNGNPVPDGTPIQFTFNLNGVESLSPSIITTGGTAKSSYVINEPGSLIIGLQTEPQAEYSQIEFIIPEQEGFNTPIPEVVVTESSTTEPPTPEPTEQAVLTPEPPIEEPRTQTDLVDWVIAILVSGIVGWFAYRLGSSLGLSRWSIRWGLGSVIGGLAAYLYLAADYEGTELVVASGRPGMIWAIVLGGIVGWVISAVWYSLSVRLSPQRKTDPPKFTSSNRK